MGGGENAEGPAAAAAAAAAATAFSERWQGGRQGEAATAAAAAAANNWMLPPHLNPHLQHARGAAGYNQSPPLPPQPPPPPGTRPASAPILDAIGTARPGGALATSAPQLALPPNAEEAAKMSGAASHDGGWGAHHRASPPVQHDNGELYAWGGGGVPNPGAPRMGAWAAGAASPSASGSALSGGRHDDDDDDEYSNSPHRMGPGGDGGAGRYGPPGGEVSRSARRRRQRARKAEARTQELKQLFVDGEGLSHGAHAHRAWRNSGAILRNSRFF